ncbi:MAG: UDP-N-acetylmuramoyl-tripeptide--D-alanyl-D-alanine ligase, partial [Eubacterium sp.]|nr:UDP-N-acetylmuramoyl-tripeptide--D-alanyl-D-alanine ligase [Eubacterium sp.]
MKHMTLQAIAEACGGVLAGGEFRADQEITAITTDSRNVTCGCLFVAIAGKRADGHDFIEDVIKEGALAVLVERDPGAVTFPFILVESSLQAVKAIAKYYLSQLAIPVVGITGSVGKTSTKDMIS